MSNERKSIEKIIVNLNNYMKKCDDFIEILNQCDIWGLNFDNPQESTIDSGDLQWKLFCADLEGFFNKDAVVRYKDLKDCESKYKLAKVKANYKNIANLRVALYNYEKFLTEYLEQVEEQDMADMCIESKISNRKVFIVHGHDKEAKIEVARCLERLNLEAIILHEQVNGGATILEKIEQNADVGFAVILYTACDEGKLKTESELKARARQNVVFEHGFFMGKLGRKRVMALKKGDVETPGDISGLVYTDMDASGAWRYTLADELKAAGFYVDKNKL